MALQEGPGKPRPGHDARTLVLQPTSRIYLGEIAAWWSLWLFALSSGLEYWWTGIGALSITLMFVYVSVPMMEAHAAVSRRGYDRYRLETPMLLPIPRKKKVERHAG